MKHNFDGIEELDNPPPNWFRALFYATIAIGTAYFLYYEIGDGPGQIAEYERARGADELVQLSRQSSSGSALPSESELQAMLKDVQRRESGKQIFVSKCASCHGAQGQGGIGPNLTDDYWIHGAKLTEVMTVITNGVGDKGMPPWGPLLSADEIRSITVYVRSLLGTNPPGAKVPQGNLVK